jgi:uncharacterized membrane protein
MTTYLVTVGLIFAIMLAGIAIDRAYRAFAAKHPQLGPFRKAGGGCGACGGGHCGDGGCGD